MDAPRFRRILHLDLDGPLPDLDPAPACRGLWLVFWRGGRAVGQLDLPTAELPLPGEALRARAAARVVEPEPLPPPAPAGLTASVVICTRDRPDHLAACLQSLRAMTRAPDEVVVVDNAPASDATRRLVEATPGVRYVAEPRPGLDIARNAGIRHSRGEVVAFVDDDVAVHPDWLERLLGAFADPQVMAVTGLVLPRELDTEAQYIFETYWSFNKGFRPRRFGPDFLARHRGLGAEVWKIGAGANMAFRRAAFDRVGGFDERLDAGAAGCSGDSEIWYRVLARGGTCRYETAAVAFHSHRRDLPGLKRQIRAYMRGHMAALLVQFERNRHWSNLFRALVLMPGYYAVMSGRAVRDGFGPRYRTLPQEMAGLVAGLWFYLRHRRSPG